MGMFITTKKSAFDKFMVMMLFAIPVFLVACGGPQHMITKDVNAHLAIKPNKAVLVIGTTTSGLRAFDFYIDGKMIGQTKGKSFFITDVEPGMRYVMARAEKISTEKIKFEAGRIYFLAWDSRIAFAPLTLDEGLNMMSESDRVYLEYNIQNPGKDLSQKDYQEAINVFAEEVRVDPKSHKKFLEYTGSGTRSRQ